ncbi:MULTISPECIES: 4'-phosphopantetheinyl transferase superfamily protein [unclassified Micromonospora]|uniref:4'-phosphopantetheinyl transferase family protein n=1 Tax=unclassified Micromonospora TaxID=2617518 RepID=UPI001C221A75|nr:MULTISPECIES: 4'-phosphopantetheinyl transferase superfamily protein [unclassified Micromonospora]MBU8859849.1 4'-phosphopantetheinyl transferase superfamily protein [Micromonospora sp. WMMB482]MDM4779371.1 4'-phosphopantetheinyl transferase superfamily protein [Micromonospora sp. b486]
MIEVLLPAGTPAVEAFTDVPDEAPYPGEEDLVARAVAARRQEFVTARRCAREALACLGYAPAPIRPGPRREPVWPDGVVGSITHCTGYRAAAVAPAGALAGLGIDAEPHEPLPDGVAGVVLTAGEPDRLAALRAADPATHWDRLLFSAKESVYKAWYPLTGRWLGFEEAELTFDRSGRFTARILVDGTRTDGGPALDVLDGRWLVAGGLLLTAVVVPHRQ